MSVWSFVVVVSAIEDISSSSFGFGQLVEVEGPGISVSCVVTLGDGSFDVDFSFSTDLF